MKELLCNNTMFGIVLCALLWQVGLWCQNKIKKPIANPLFISMVLGVIVLVVFDIPLEWFRRGANMMDMLLLPATAALGLSVWRQRKVLLDNFWPVVIGCAVGCVVNVGAVWGMCRLAALDASLKYSLLPRSVTTPIAVALSEQGGGMPAITVTAVMVTGILGAVFAPAFAKLLRLENCPVAVGVAIGTSSHVLGTTAAMEMGPVQEAMSSVAIGVSGLITVALAMLW